MAIVGYARVSTREQETYLQMDALRLAGCGLIYEEKASGASQRGRPELARCIGGLLKGDLLVVYKIDRVARSLFDLLDILRRIEKAGATIKSITEPLDTTNSMGMFVVQILGAVAQLERSIIRERSMAGQEAARLRGRFPGRVRDLLAEDEHALVAEYLAGDTTYEALGKKFGVSSHVAKRAVYRVRDSGKG